MKCPKCGYLGFESADRCRNCGYDFSLSPTDNLPELQMRSAADTPNPLDDLAFVDAAFASPTTASTAEFSGEIAGALGAFRDHPATAELPLFDSRGSDDAPLITKASPPRAPLAVRRSTPEAHRLKTSQVRMPMLDLTVPEVESPDPAPAHDSEPQPATVGARVAAVAIDFLILTIVDAVVIYFTIQICGLTIEDLNILPKGPLLAFLLVQNGGYLVVFTAGGQTLGKMIAGIRVVSAERNGSLDIGHSIVRTVVWVLLAVPAGLGFVTALFSADRRGLHDRCAGTKVIRASAA